MQYKILLSFAVAALLSTSHSDAQNNTAFAVTAQTKGNFNWNVIREINLSTGEVVRTVYDPAFHKVVYMKAVAGSPESSKNTAGTSTLGSAVAAAAFDALHNRLYFTNMRSNSLLYIDLTANDLNIVENNSPVFNTGNKNDEANVITRMGFGADGFGYAITNDGRGFVRFTTDQKPTITNLGELIDGSKNGTMSIHSQCSSWGGDVVGDAYGNLYLVTYRNHVFKINPATRIADYMGQLKGISAEFTTNGVVVNDEGDLIVSSATKADNYYKVNISTLTAIPVQKKETQVYNSSDLANANLLYQRKGTERVLSREVRGNQEISIYPNPAVNKSFSVQFDKVPVGKYNLVLSDASGRAVMAKSITIAMTGQIERLALPRSTGGGLFMVKLVGGDSKVLYSDRLMVE